MIRCDAESLSSHRDHSRIFKARVHNAPTGAPALPLPTPHAFFTPWSVSKIASLPSLPSFLFRRPSPRSCWRSEHVVAAMGRSYDVARVSEVPRSTRNIFPDARSSQIWAQVAIRRAETVDDPALHVNDATWTENSRFGVMHIAWIQGILCTCDHLAYKCGWRFSSAPVLHLACSGDRNALMCFCCFKGAPLVSDEEEEEEE